MEPEIEVDIPSDATQIDETGHPWAFLDEAMHTDRVRPGAIVANRRRHGSHLCTRVVAHRSTVRAESALRNSARRPVCYIDAMRRTHLLSA